MEGTLCHFEIPGKDVKATGEFYSKIFGWKMDDSYPNYLMFNTGKEPGGGIEKREPFSNGVMIYIQVNDIIETLDTVKASGGTVIKEKTEIPNVGHFGLFDDIDGNTIGIFQSK
ncbi:MAG: VOC family protein [candidate division Zixibacteria bacterium]|nr:VOC family protein [candidate division Zixibacteria bacterium]